VFSPFSLGFSVLFTFPKVEQAIFFESVFKASSSRAWMSSDLLATLRVRSRNLRKGLNLNCFGQNNYGKRTVSKLVGQETAEACAKTD